MYLSATVRHEPPVTHAEACYSEENGPSISWEAVCQPVTQWPLTEAQYLLTTSLNDGLRGALNTAHTLTPPTCPKAGCTGKCI